MKKIFVLTTMLFAVQSVHALGLRLGVEANMMKPSATVALSQLGDETFDQTGFGVTAFGLAELVLIKITGNFGYLNFGEQSYSYDFTDLPIEQTSISAKAKAISLSEIIPTRAPLLTTGILAIFSLIITLLA